jgi:hypothetical protein
MKKISVLVAICVMSATTIAFGQKYTQHVSFDDQVGPGDAGTYNSTDHFSVDLYLTYAGYDSPGFSLWLATTADAAPHIFLTDFTYAGPFDVPTQPFAGPIGFTQLLFDGTHYTTPNPSDLGSTKDPLTGLVPAGTYFIGHLSIDLSGMAPGTYLLQSSDIGPHRSEVTRFDGTTFVDSDLPAAFYTITIVPEPSTLALLSVTAIGIGLGSAGARLRKRSY